MTDRVYNEPCVCVCVCVCVYDAAAAATVSEVTSQLLWCWAELMQPEVISIPFFHTAPHAASLMFPWVLLAF